ncbi:MAG: hypothetical protein ACRDP7_38550 [Trebonia sp.]
MDKVIRYTHLALQALPLLDEGDSLDLDDTRKHAENGTLFAWLESEFGSRIDLSLFDSAVRGEMSERFAMLANATSTSDLGISRSGLALVVAYCLEMIQQDRQTR